MADYDDEIILGLQSIYDANPIESVSTLSNEDKNKNELNEDKAKLNQPKVEENAKEDAGRNNISDKENCLNMVQSFQTISKEFKDYKEVEKWSKETQKMFEEKKEWAKQRIEKVKSGQLVITDSEWAENRNQAENLFAEADRIKQDFANNNTFHAQDSVYDAYKKVFMDEKTFEYFQSQHLNEKYLDCSARLQRQYKERDDAEKAFKDAMKTYEEAKNLFIELDKERSKQKSRDTYKI